MGAIDTVGLAEFVSGVRVFGPLLSQRGARLEAGHGMAFRPEGVMLVFEVPRSGRARTGNP
jgi:hypothetical protein